MIPRVLVPTNARISPTQSSGPAAIRQHLLVPRKLIPANARLQEDAASSGAASIGETTAASRHLIVPKLLVPPDARIGTIEEHRAAGSASLATRANVFGEALLPKNTLGRRSSYAEWLISVGVHASIVVAVLVVPLMYTQVIDLQHFQIAYLAAPPTPAAPPPPPPPAVAPPQQVARKVLPTSTKLTMAIAAPKTVPSSSAEAPPDIIAGILGGAPGGVPGGPIGGVLGGILGGTGLVVPPQPVPAAPVLVGPLHLGGEVKPPRKIYAPAPQYPTLARQALIEGDVEIDAVIDKEGNVVEEHAMSGPTLLIAAALEAVKHWKYQPTYLNGVPWAIELTIHVTFRL